MLLDEQLRWFLVLKVGNNLYFTIQTGVCVSFSFVMVG